MNDIAEGTWKGDPEALRKAKSRFWKNITDGCVSMASSYYSYIKVVAQQGVRGKFIALWYAFLSRLLLAIATKWRSPIHYDSNQLSVMAGIYGSLSLTRIGLKKALQCAEFGVDGELVDCCNPHPHTLALLWADRAILHMKVTGDLDQSLQFAEDAVELRGMVLSEENLLQAKRQFSRVLQKCGGLYLQYCRDDRECLRGKELLREAKVLAEQSGATSQLLKF